MIEPTLALIGLILSAFFSGSEIAFIQANPLQIEVWRRQGRKFARKASRLVAEPERYLTTVLVGTNLANVLTSSYATIALVQYGVPQKWTVVLIAAVILIFGEILPKSLFRENANTLAVGVTPLLHSAGVLFTPFVSMVKAYSRFLGQGNGSSSSSSLTREELKFLFREAETHDEVEEDEIAVISRIFEFGSQPVKRAMTPRPDIVAIKSDTTVNDTIQIMSDTGLSKLPVYERDLDAITGMVFLHDLFTGPDTLASILKRPLFVPESMSANETLKELKRHRSSIAIVVAPDGRTSGLVTDEDLIEELFGEIEDVFDEEGRKVTRMPDSSLVVDTLVDVRELNDRYGFSIPEGNYRTIGGFLLSRLGRIPRAGEMLNFETFYIKIVSATPNRLKRLRIGKIR